MSKLKNYLSGKIIKYKYELIYITFIFIIYTQTIISAGNYIPYVVNEAVPLLLLVAWVCIFLFVRRLTSSIKKENWFDKFFLGLLLTLIASNFIYEVEILNANVNLSNEGIASLLGLFIACLLLVWRINKNIFFGALGVYLITGLITSIFFQSHTSSELQSKDPTFSKNKKNIIVLVVDTTKSSLFGEAFRSIQKNYVVYPNNFATYSSTFTSLPYIFSNIKPENLNYVEYQNKFVCKNIQTDLVREGWDVYNFPYPYLKESFPIDKCNTTHIRFSERKEIKNISEANKILKTIASAYVYQNKLPNIFNYRSILQGAVDIKSKTDDELFKKWENLSVKPTDKNVFAFYHLDGLHAPVEKVSASSSMLEDYISKSYKVNYQIKKFVDSLKSKGISDDTLIVVMGDHGTSLPEYMEKNLPGSSGGETVDYIKLPNNDEGGVLVKRHGTDHRYKSLMNWLHFYGYDNNLVNAIKNESKSYKRPYNGLILETAYAFFGYIDMRSEQKIVKEEVVFTGDVSNIIRNYAGLKTNDVVKAIHFTPFSGKLTREKIKVTASCRFLYDSFFCDYQNPNVEKYKRFFANKQHVSLTFFGLDDAKERCINLKNGRYLYSISDLSCLTDQEDILYLEDNMIFYDPRYVFISDAVYMKDLVFTSMDYDSGGVGSLLGYSNQALITGPSSFQFTVKSLNSSNIKIDVCGDSFDLSFKDGTLITMHRGFQPGDSFNSACSLITFFNSNPLDSFILAGRSKDWRLVSFQSFVVKDVPFRFLNGVGYPKESSGSYWIASYPFKVDNNFCQGNNKLHLYPSKGDRVVVRYFKSGKDFSTKVINSDSLLGREYFCDLPDFDFMIFESDIKNFRLPNDDRVYAAQLFVEI